MSPALPPALRADLAGLAEIFGRALEKNGVTPQGVLWPRSADLARRFEVLLGPLNLPGRDPAQPAALLDLGCGPGFLLDWLAENGWQDRIAYTGTDITDITMRHAAARWPAHKFLRRDVRDAPFPAQSFDYALICGIFTARFHIPHAEFRAMAQETLRAVWPSVREGLAFNVMSKHVDWEREDLFHWPLDEIMGFCKAELSRHVSFRLDYGLWETAVFIRREPEAPRSRVPGCWRQPG